MNETRDIHPLVAVWLTKNGYSYVHEYTMPDFGRVDFYATHSDGHTLLVEAKGNDYHKVITQLAGYGIQIPEARKAVAIPLKRVSDKIKALTGKYGILLIEVDYQGDHSEKRERDPIEDAANSQLVHRMMNTEKKLIAPEYVVNAVLAWHEAHNSHPLLDLLILYASCGQSNPEIWADSVVFSAQEIYSNAVLDVVVSSTDNMTAKEALGAAKLIDMILDETAGAVSLPRIAGTSMWKDLE